MRFSTLAVAAATAGAASAGVIRKGTLPTFPSTGFPTLRRLGHGGIGTHASNATSTSSGGYQQVVYWGQNDSEQDLSEYCAANEGIDILVLSFISTYGDGALGGGFGDCTIGSSPCTKLESDVLACQKAGKKVFVSVGGGGAANKLTTSNAVDTANELWNSYGSPSATKTGSPRPLGSAAVDGWDFDIESNNGGNTGYAPLIAQLRKNFEADKSKTYYISGAPQCPIPEPNMGDMIKNAKFDKLFIQFYNNPECESQGGTFNFDDWESSVSGGASKGADLFIGLPASKDAAGNGYLQPSDMATLVNKYKSHAGFSGVMLWDAGSSDELNDNGCHYAQEVASVLKTGKTC